MHVPHPAEILHGTPKAGAVGEVETVIRAAEIALRYTQAFCAEATAAGDRLAGLESSAVTALRVRVSEQLVAGARRVEASAETAKTLLSRYVGEVERIHRAADRIVGDVEERTAGIQRSAGVIAQICAAIAVRNSLIWHTPPGMVMPEPRLDLGRGPVDAAERAAALHTLDDAHRARWQHAVLDWERDLEQVRALGRGWEILIEERFRAENTLEMQLRDTPLGQLVTLAAASPRGFARTIALGLAGGSEGRSTQHAELRTEHPLLATLFPGGDAAEAWDNPPDPVAVASWWALLTPTEREEVIRVVPAAVGNLPGLPASVRDRANRTVLAHYLAQPQLLDARQLRLIAEVQRILDATAAQLTSDPPVQVLAFDVAHEVPKAAIAYGHLDTATHITWQVPGMNSDAADALRSWDTAARNLFLAERSLLWREGEGTPGVVAWLGYDTPPPPPHLGVLRSEAAIAGSARLAAELDGMQTAQSFAGEPARTTVVAHSYGTTVASLALSLVSVPVTSFVMLGSAGLDTRLIPTLEAVRSPRASRPEHAGEAAGSEAGGASAAAPTAVYATNAPDDRLAPTGAVLSRRGLPTPDSKAVLGLQAQVPVYGEVISFPSAGDPHRGLRATNGHSVIGVGARKGIAGVSASEGQGYGDPGTQSLTTTARIATQTLDPRTIRSFSTTHAQHVRELVDTSGGRKTFVRVTPQRADAE